MPRMATSAAERIASSDDEASTTRVEVAHEAIFRVWPLLAGWLEEEREFPDLVLDAWLTATEAARVEAFEALGQRLEQARHAHEGAKELDEKLFGQDFEAA